MDDIDRLHGTGLDRLDHGGQARAVVLPFCAADAEIPPFDDDLIISIAIRLGMVEQGLLHLERLDTLLALFVGGEPLIDEGLPSEGQADQVSGRRGWHRCLDPCELFYVWICE